MGSEGVPPLPGPWRDLLGAALEGDWYRQLRRGVAREYRRHTVYPPAADVFRALELTPPESARVVILGQDPYHGEGQAHGLAFSVPPRIDPPPSLRNIFRELEDDLGVEPPGHGCLEAWARRGVLLLNVVLTVRAGDAGSHRGLGWERLTDEVIRSLDRRRPPAVFALWGNDARSKAALLGEDGSPVVEATHPSPLSAHRGFLGTRPFSRIQQALRRAGREPVDWRLPKLDGG
ncbi:MAG: uracil-DNA glycosylase [Acidobacteriota bacterium]